MKLVLTGQNIEELLRSTEQQLSVERICTIGERSWQFATAQVEGHIHRIEFPLGLELVLHQYVLTEPLTVTTDYTLDRPHIGWDFWLSGGECTIERGSNRSYEYGAGQSRFAFIPEFRGTQELRAGKVRYLEVNVTLDRLLGLGGEVSDLPAPLPALFEGKRSNFYLHTRSILPSMRSTIYQILNCPYQGVSRRLYLESRAIDLVAASLAQPWESDLKLLESEDIDRIEAARQILLDRLDHPPSLMELAQQVGLNDCTLKRGFRQVFGTTAFGYLYQQRMEQARILLASGEWSVSAVAELVGYGNVSAFSTAFRRKFGRSPKSCRIRK